MGLTITLAVEPGTDHIKKVVGMTDVAQDAEVKDTSAAAPVATDAPVEKAEPQGSFEDFDLCQEVREAIEKMGYQAPTEVQSAVFHVALTDKDLVVQSKTGSGKTSAFGIPMIHKMAPGSGTAKTPAGLVLAPTRELANQVCAELEKLSEFKGVKILAVYGGVSLVRQAELLEAGVDIIVGTPGRLLDHVRRGNLDLSGIQTITLDEADEMLSMGFWDDVTDIIKMTPDTRQTMLFSATLPYQIAKAAVEYLKEPERIDLSGDIITVEGIENSIFHVQNDTPKPRQLLYLLETIQPESAIIFCNTRNETDILAKYLTQSGFVAKPLSGHFRQSSRDRVMNQIKSGKLKYMVATDVAARGIDISDLSHVFNYSLPEFTEVYVHRVGRTGRAGKCGHAMSMVDGKGIATLSSLEREYKIQFEEMQLAPEDEILTKRSQRIMQELSEKASVAEVGQHLDVAKNIVDSEESAQIVAFLLKSYYTGQTQEAGPKSNRRSNHKQQAEGERGNEEDGQSRNGKRRRRRRRRGGNKGGSIEGALSAKDALDGLPPPANPAAASKPSLPPAAEGMVRVRVNIGFDDGFKGRGSVAKKISALAGLNDGIVREVESKREYAVLEASSDITELLIDRVDGAQIGKKIVSVGEAS